jgi:hypothetical protein
MGKRTPKMANNVTSHGVIFGVRFGLIDMVDYRPYCLIYNVHQNTHRFSTILEFILISLIIITNIKLLVLEIHVAVPVW